MTAILGFCTARGAFLAADTQQTDPNTLKPYPKAATKITKLAAWVVVGISGAGFLDIGDDLRVETKRAEADRANLDEFLQRIGRVLRRIHGTSVYGFGKQRAATTAILAGHDRVKDAGFLCALQHALDFTPQMVVEAGLKTATGTLPLVSDTMTAVLEELRLTESRLPLDHWALEALRRISENDPTVGLPAHLAIVDEHDAVVYAAQRDTPRRDCFLVDFPEPTAKGA